jgi:hypothetical protein
MRFDRVWVQCSGNREQLHERRAAEKEGLSEEFDAHYERLYRQGNFVVLSAGKNFAFDELFLFQTSADAEDFYNTGFMKFESFIGDDDEGFGFDQISLSQGGRLVHTKSTAPTARIALNRAECNEWWETTGKFTCDVLDDEQ